VPLEDYFGKNFYCKKTSVAPMFLKTKVLDLYIIETEGSKGFRDLMALGCSILSEARALLKGQRVSKSRRT